MKPPEDRTSIEGVRRAIDTLDREIVRLIDRRAGYVRAAARLKTGGADVRAPNGRERCSKSAGDGPERKVLARR